MNFTKIINMQRALDKSIASNHNIDESKIENKRLLALLVELGEFANEYAPFKYWKKNIIIDRNKLIEEFVDGVHFFSSFIIHFDIKDQVIHSVVISKNKTNQLLETFKAIIDMGNNLNETTLRYAFGVYLGNARLLKLTNEEIEESYIKKNKINFKRIKDQY